MTTELNTEELQETIAAEERAMHSLVGFREAFIPSKDDVKPAPFHEEWSKILLEGKDNFAIEVFRESAKTQTLASKKLVEVSREYLATPAMNGLMTSVKDNSGLALEVHYRNGAKVRIEAYGKGAAVRGLSWGSKRPDLVIIDDPQDSEDARSEAVTSSDWDWFLSDVYFLGKNTRIFLIGTNLGERCIIERVIKSSEFLNFTARRIPILTKDGTGRGCARA